MTGPSPLPAPPLDPRRARRTAAICVGAVVAMVGLAYASVPLYNAFCRATGFAGTPIVRSQTADTVSDHTIAVRFDSNVAPGLNWQFTPEANEVTVKLGEPQTAYFKVRNGGSTPSTGVATFNVQPDLAGAYFVKMQCFCFDEQTLAAGETVESAVVFYVDPALLKDSNVKDLPAITLSYTYFPSKVAKPVAATGPSPAKSDL